MKQTNRFFLGGGISFFLLALFLSGCIVVVEEDDDRHRRYLHESEWRLEIVFYRAETLVAHDRQISVQFEENGSLVGSASCGDFSGDYTLSDNGGISVGPLTLSSDCSSSTDLQRVTAGLREARTFTVDEKALTISAANEGFLSFSIQ